jgi:CheY-like chemotaxis protein
MTGANCHRVVMIVEDDVDVRDSIVEVLADHDFQPLGARDGCDALNQLRSMEIKPSLILLDVMMPVMDGRQFRLLQKSDPSLSAIPVVVITAHGSAPEAARQMDAVAFLRKPVPLQTLLATVERYCCGGAAQS